MMSSQKDLQEKASKLKTGNPFKSSLGTSGCPDGMVWEELVPNEDIYYGPIINEQGFF